MTSFDGRIHPRLLEFAKNGDLVIMAGSGVSAGKPAALPGWYSLNAAIAQVLSRRLDEYLGKPGWTSKFLPAIENYRNTGAFPPDYQAQVIEEICGDNYFKALKSLDVDAVNSSHEAIARLAASGCLRCIVTTNFDGLIEQALAKYRVRSIVAYDEPGFKRMAERLLSEDNDRTIPIIKIHGSVTDHLSMIDTLKQRKAGRSKYLQNCLDKLHTSYWIYDGFSAEDLETDNEYLGLIHGANYGSGATYLAYPLNPALKRGAQLLMEAYEERGEVVIAYDHQFLSAINDEYVQKKDAVATLHTGNGLEQFQRNLERWANALEPATAGLCISAICEAIGQTEIAVRILDYLVRKDLYEYRDTPEFRLLQLSYGRLGATWGRFFGVPDMNGAASNASVESTQSLLRLIHTDLEFPARCWLCVLYLWLNEGENATRSAIKIFEGVLTEKWEGRGPASPEELADAWLSAAQVSILNSGPELINVALRTADLVYAEVMKNGNVIRAARVMAMKGLCLAQTTVDMNMFFAQHENIFRDATRAGDGFSLGFRALALGRWSVGAGGIKQSKKAGSDAVAKMAHHHLDEAADILNKTGMDAWLIYSSIQHAKTFADLRNFDEAEVCLEYARRNSDRFAIMITFIHEAEGQILQMRNNPDAVKSFHKALFWGKESGLTFRVKYLENAINTQFGNGT